MKKVCVITGGGSGMGLATAKLACEAGYYTILVGRTASKLEKAVADLRKAGQKPKHSAAMFLTGRAALRWPATPLSAAR